jgi:hypothetical protein
MRVQRKRSRIIINEDKKNDILYIGYPTDSYTVGIDFSDDIILHYDKRRKRVVGITILHLEKLKKELDGKEKDEK